MTRGAELLARATPEERALMEAAFRHEAQHRKEHPLAWARLWHSPRTSQRVAARLALDPSVLFAFILGGNRAGKTDLAAQLALAVAQGRDHPDTAAWAEANGLDLRRVATGPGVVVIGSGDSNDSRRVMRPKVATYAPAGTKWRNRDGQGEAEALLPDGGRIVFKSVDQGRDGWQGFAARLIVFDEEPLDLGVVNEALIRLADLGGWLVFSMTPLMGWTPLLEEHLRGEQAANVVRYSLYGPDNPHVDAEALRTIYAKYGAHEKAAREKGDIVALEGRIYTDWDRALHVVESFTPPPDWPRFAGVDFGTRNPTAIVWCALDPRDDVLHVYREHYQAMETQEWHVRRYLALTDIEPDWVIADPAGTAERMTWAALDVPTLPAYKGPGSVRAGISAVAERLAPDVEGRPHLVVHDSCPAAIREFEGYVWKSRKTKADMPDEPEKRNDHALDAIRYLVHHLARLGDLYQGE